MASGVTHIGSAVLAAGAMVTTVGVTHTGAAVLAAGATHTGLVALAFGDIHTVDSTAIIRFSEAATTGMLAGIITTVSLMLIQDALQTLRIIEVEPQIQDHLLILQEAIRVDHLT